MRFTTLPNLPAEHHDKRWNCENPPTLGRSRKGVREAIERPCHTLSLPRKSV